MERARIDAPVAPAAGEPVKILIVSADVGLREDVGAAAARLGLCALQAGDGAAALNLYEQQRPRVLVAASRLSTVDGVSLVRRIRGLSGSTQVPAVVLLTQDAWEDMAGYDAGADNCLRSPVEPAVLEGALRAVARRADARRRMAGRLRRAQAMADAMRDGMFTVDGSGAITWVNAAFVRMFGYAEQELAGRNMDRLISASPEQRNAVDLHQCLGARIAASNGATCEMQGRRRDGSIFAIELSLSVLAHDGASGFVGVIREIDARQAAEAELAEKTAQLIHYRDEHESEVRLAQEIMERLLDRGGLADARLRYAAWAAQRFSGDVVAAARSPGGRLYVMLADAMGHGLAAAISLLPAITVFYGMAARNLPLSMMVGEMNSKLRGTLPVGRFVAATLLCIDEPHRSAEVWIGGNPDVLWLDGDGNVIERFASNRLPLGIADTSPLYAHPGFFEWHERGQLFACSDGLGEARNAAGEQFESERIMVALAGSAPAQRIAAVESALRHHLDGVAAEDDIALLTVDLT